MTWSGAAGGSSAPARWGTPPRSTRWPPVCAGDRHRRATKILGLLTTSAKSYAATIRLGQTTATEDAEGELLQHRAMCRSPKQSPYCAARSCRCRRWPARSRSTASGPASWPGTARPSNWPAIRALARDLGDALGVGTHLTALRRTASGRFRLDQARTLDDLAGEARLSYTLDEACLQTFPRRDLSAAEAESAAHGRALKPVGIDGVYAATDPDGRVIALLEDCGARTKSVVVIRPATL